MAREHDRIRDEWQAVAGGWRRWEPLFQSFTWPGALARLRRALDAGGRIAVTAWAPPDDNPWIAIPMQELARVLPVPPADLAAPGLFYLSADGALAEALRAAGFRNVAQERVQLSQFAREVSEFWAMLADMAGPLAPLVAGLAGPERERVMRSVSERLGRFRSGDVFRIPAQAQLAWGEL